MQWSDIQANWHLLKGHVVKKWGQLTDDEVAELNGEFEQFVGLLQKKLNVDRDVAEFQVKEFQTSLNETSITSRESFVEHISDGIQQTNERLVQLRQKAATASDDGKESINKELAVAADRYEVAAKRMKELQSSTGDAWKDLVDGCRQSWQQFKEACDSAWKRFES